MATKVKGQRLNEGAAAENLGFNPDKRPIQGEGEPTSITPEYIGQQYVDTTENKMYFATGTEEGNREAVGAGGGDFDPAGYYSRLHAGITDQIYTDENTISIGDWNFRTTAGDVSVPSSGEAKLLAIKGAPLRRVSGQTDTLAQFEITATEGIIATIENKYSFIAQANNTTGTYTFTLSGGSWDTDPSDWGIHETHEGLTNGTITVNFTAENRADLRAIRPHKLMATGVNQMGVPGYFKMDGYRIDNGEIKADDGSHFRYLYCVPAYGGVTNGYMARDFNSDIISVGRCANRPDVGTILQQNNIQGDGAAMFMPFEQTGRFVVEDVNGYSEYSGVFSIHPRWSNQQGENNDGYVNHDAYLPNSSTNRGTLPYCTDYGYGKVGLPAIGDVYDEINMQTGKYIQRIGYSYFSDTYNRYNFIASLPTGTRFEYDNYGVYYVLESENILDMYMDGYSGVYTANDYGTEWILDENGNLIEEPTGVKTSYGTNLVDKLRTGVPSKDQLPRVMFQQQYSNLSEERKNNGAITFIYTADKPDTFEPVTASGTYMNTLPISNYTLDFAHFTPAGYPFEVSITSNDTSIIQITGTPYISGDYVYCNVDILQTGTCTGTITIGGVTKSRDQNIYQG